MFTRAFATLRMAKSAFAVTYTFMDFGAVLVLRLSLQIVRLIRNVYIPQEVAPCADGRFKQLVAFSHTSL